MQTSLLWMYRNEACLYHSMLLSQFCLFSSVRPLDIVSVSGVHLPVNPAAEVRGFLGFSHSVPFAASASSVARTLSAFYLPLHFPLLSSSTLIHFLSVVSTSLFCFLKADLSSLVSACCSVSALLLKDPRMLFPHQFSGREI